jgi:hypothetical protein
MPTRSQMVVAGWLVGTSACGDGGAGPDGGATETDASGSTAQPTSDPSAEGSAGPSTGASTTQGTTQGDSGGPTGCDDLDARIAVTEISTEGVAVSTASPEFFTHVRPVLLAVAPGGAAFVAWVGTDGLVHATPLGSDDTRAAPDLTVMGDDLRGLVAHDDGVAVLVKRDDAMHLVRIATDGTEQFDRMLVGGNDHGTEGDKWVNMWGHNGRLAWSGDTYAAYFGHAQNFGSEGEHQGDLLQIVTAAGETTDGGWSWGCSHSDDARIVFTGAGPRAGFVPICGSDCYPATGIVFDNSQSILTDPSGDCTGTIDTQLGDLVALAGDAVLTFATPVGRSSFDVGITVMADGGGSFAAPIWLQDTADRDEMHPHAAVYGDDLLVTWDVGATTEVARVAADGAIIESIGSVTHAIAESSSAVTFANGDVGWAFAVEAGTSVSVARVPLCDLP